MQPKLSQKSSHFFFYLRNISRNRILNCTHILIKEKESIFILQMLMLPFYLMWEYVSLLSSAVRCNIYWKPSLKYQACVCGIHSTPAKKARSWPQSWATYFSLVPSCTELDPRGEFPSKNYANQTKDNELPQRKRGGFLPFFFSVLLKIHIYEDCGKETEATLLVFLLYKKKYKSTESETIKDLC